MKTFVHTPSRLKTRRLLPGHTRTSRQASGPLPGVDRAERIARRRAWTDHCADQRFQYGLGGSVGLAGALLALVMMLFAAVGPAPNVLDATAHAAPPEAVQNPNTVQSPETAQASETVQTATIAPAASADAAPVEG